MIFKETKLKGAFVVELEKRKDPRGFFARVFCEKEFSEHGLEGRIAQISMASNPEKGTLRGMHFQNPPYEEDKLIRCTSGAIYDVIIDLRKDSATYKEWFGIELNSENGKSLYIPKGFAHGYLTLQDQTELIYLMTQFYQPGHENGFRYNDPAFQIFWPDEVKMISDKDKNWPDYKL